MDNVFAASSLEVGDSFIFKYIWSVIFLSLYFMNVRMKQKSGSQGWMPWLMSVIPGTWEWRQEDHGLRPTQAKMWDTILKTN
jgi:hypothetical protein